LWGIYGAIYFKSRSKKIGKPVYAEKPAPPAAVGAGV
jgi:hypothetical protein